MSALVRVSRRECVRCGFHFVLTADVEPDQCLECRTAPQPVPPPLDPASTPGYRLALVVTEMRLAIEEARAALYLGRTREALEALDRVPPPGQSSRSLALP